MVESESVVPSIPKIDKYIAAIARELDRRHRPPHPWGFADALGGRAAFSRPQPLRVPSAPVPSTQPNDAHGSEMAPQAFEKARLRLGYGAGGSPKKVPAPGMGGPGMERNNPEGPAGKSCAKEQLSR
jgi:hypothetical protein